MAKIRKRRIHWDAPSDTDVVGYDVYVASASEDSAQFLSDADTGNRVPTQHVPIPEYFPDQEEGDWQYCVIVLDDAGNESDPYQHEAWRNVPLDVTAPGPASGGGLDFG